jgi:hypothetical protein
MGKYLFVLSLFVLAFIVLTIFFFKRTHIDREGLFKNCREIIRIPRRLILNLILSINRQADMKQKNKNYEYQF